MICPHCHQELNENDQFCHYCGERIIKTLKNCPNCGQEITDDYQICPQCGFHLPLQRVEKVKKRSKTTAIILGIFLGGVGAHNFYLGYSSKGYFQAVLFFSGILTVWLTTFIAIVWGIIDAIMITFGSIDRDGDDNLLL